MKRGLPTWILGAWIAVALGADCVASDLPLAASVDGELYLLPNVTRPAELRAQSLRTLDALWLVTPPITWGPREQAKGERPYARPGRAHWLGGDAARRDVAARLVHGARTALLIGLSAVALYVAIGTLLGLLAGYVGGGLDRALRYLVELVLSVPGFFLLLALVGIFDRLSTVGLIAVIAFVSWPRVQRLVRAETLRQRAMPFMDAARALGASHSRIIFRHLLPHLSHVLVPALAFGLAQVVLLEATLSFLGFGLPEDAPSWGGLMRDAMDNPQAWWLIVFPGACVAALLWSLQGLGARFDRRAARGQMEP